MHRPPARDPPIALSHTCHSKHLPLTTGCMLYIQRPASTCTVFVCFCLLRASLPVSRSGTRRCHTAPAQQRQQRSQQRADHCSCDTCTATSKGEGRTVA
jgi:hypothetical protein